MPEIAEVARIVHFLRIHLVGKKIQKAIAPEDSVLFGKVGTTGAAFEDAARGKEVVSAGSQGKYFWIVFNKPPHVVMHFGMTGWIHIRGAQTAYTNYYKKMKPGEADQWPPKYWKFQLETEGNPSVQMAFTDPRRFGRVRVVDCPGDEIRNHSPLVENGPDPVVDAVVFTKDFLQRKMRSRHVAIKALLLDQAAISGIGNWVADEVLYQSRLHPEQYCDEFSLEEIARLHSQIRNVCQTAVDKLGDSDQFPEHWLFNYRWGKGGKGGMNKLPNGERLAFVTVGGRTSCYAPAVQKKTGKVIAGAKERPLNEAAGSKKPPLKRKSVKMEKDDEDDEDEDEDEHEHAAQKKSPRTRKRKVAPVKKPKQPGPKSTRDNQPTKEDSQDESDNKTGTKANGQPKTETPQEDISGRRRSNRLNSKQGQSSPYFETPGF